jgi:maleate isomerase
MPDVLGWRLKFGVIGPSTNTIVEPDYEAMRPAGITNHYARIFTPNAAPTNETFRAAIGVIDDNVMDALKSAMTCGPHYLLMAVSAISFFGGANGADALVHRIRDCAGVGVSIGSHSLAAALSAYGGIERIAILSPYWPVMNEAVSGYFSDMGFRVIRDLALRCGSWTAIAEVTPAQCRDALRKLDGDEVDAIVQVGTNLSMVRFAAAAELWLGKPVVAVNAATYWHALRANGIKDRIEGFGRLLAEF